MSYARLAPLKLTMCGVLLALVLPTACATGVEPDVEDSGDTSEPTDSAGSSPGGTPSTAGSGTVLPHAGTTGTGGSASTNPFGGTSSAGTASGGGSSAGTASGGQAAGGKGGAGGAASAGTSAGGSGGAAAGAGGAGSGCACPKTLTWVDNTVLSWKTGDCLEVAGAKYLYIGMTNQTYANGQCNPTKQEAWCPDGSNDYKFMLCK